MQKAIDVLKELTFFDEYVKLDSGDICQFENGLVIFNDEPLNDDEYIRVQFNEDIAKNLAKFIRIILNKRGIKDLASITVNDLDVKQAINAKKKEYKNRNIKIDKDLEDLILREAVSTVHSKHEPHYQKAMIDLFLWGLMQRDLFLKSKEGVSTKIEDLTPLKEYFEQQDTTNDVEIMLLEYDNAVFEPKPNENEPLEQMIAIVYDLLNKYENFSKVYYEKYLQKALTYFMKRNDTTDDINYFRAELEALLSS